MAIKTTIILVLLLFFSPAVSMARDYKVVLFEEHYKEKMVVGGGDYKIYHTWQVKTEFGNKLLILVGKDYAYRKWLRRTRKRHTIFLVKIPDDGDEMFRKDLGILVDVQQIHPVWNAKWKCEECQHNKPDDEGLK